MCVRGVFLGTPAMYKYYELPGFKSLNDQAYFMVHLIDESGGGLILPIDENA
jgi:hypothetical protein